LLVRIAASGVGHWHSLYDAAYLKSLLRIDEARLVAVHDPDAAMVASRAAVLGCPATYTDYREMLAKTRPDFVIVLGRHSDMAQAAHHLLDEAYPFLIEKPAGVNAAEVCGIADKARAKRAFAAVPLFQRFHPFVSNARRLLAKGALGALSHFYFRSNRPTSARYVAWGAEWMLDPAVAGGGCLRNVGLHGIDAFLHVIGEETEVTGAQLSSRALGKSVEDYATLLLRTRSGVLGTIEVGNTCPASRGDAEWRLAGSDALLVHRGASVQLVSSAGEEVVGEPPPEPLPVLALRDALARWQRGEAPAANLEDCYRAMRLVDDAYRMSLHLPRNERAADRSHERR
jgi:predicted dehydrogenase